MVDFRQDRIQKEVDLMKDQETRHSPNSSNHKFQICEADFFKKKNQHSRFRMSGSKDKEPAGAAKKYKSDKTMFLKKGTDA